MTKSILFLLILIFTFSDAFAQTVANEKACEVMSVQSLERQMSSGEIHCYQFELLKNQFLQVRAEQKSIDIVLSFFDSNGELITEIDSLNGEQNAETLSLIAEETGIYKLKITASETELPKGIYTIFQTALRNATEADRVHFEARSVFTQAKKSTVPSEAFSLFQKSAELFQQIGDRRSLAETLTEAGISAIYARNGNAALISFEKSLLIYTELADKREPAKIIKYIGFIYALSGNLKKALEKYEQALPLFNSKDAGDKADTLEAIGNIYSQTSRFSKSLENYLAALPIFNSTREFEREAGTLNNIGKIYLEIGRTKDALVNFQKALIIAQKNGYTKSEVVFLNNVGRAYDDLNEKTKAKEHFISAFSKTDDKKVRAFILLSIGKVEFDAGNAEKGFDDFKQALNLFQENQDNLGQSRALNAIARYYSWKNDKIKAVEYYNRAVKIQKDSGFKRSEAATLNNLMAVWRTMKNQRLAIFYGKMAVNLFQQIRADLQSFDEESQRSFIRSIGDTYRMLAALLIEEGRISEAQEVLILLKAEEFYQYTRRSSDADTTRQLELNDTERESAEKYKLISENTEFIEFSKKLAELFAGIPTEKNSKTANPQTENWQKQLTELGAETVLLTTLIAEERYYVIITTATSQTVRSFDIKQSELNEKIKKTRQILENPRTLPQTAAQDLYRILFAPIEEDLSKINAKNLLWSLDGNLRYLPFAALHDGEKYLVEKYTNVVVTLAQIPSRLTAAPKNWRALGAGVTTEAKDLKPLPNVSAELKTIIREESTLTSSKPETGMFAGKRLIDTTFSLSNLTATLKEDFQLIHFATHFVFRSGKDVDSFLLLGGGEKLNLADIRTGEAFDFTGTDLLTLSACETALDAPDVDGVEIESFAVIVQRRGARSVLASLWSVADDSTRKMMIEFYSQYKKGNGLTSKAEALRQAQLFILKNNAEKNKQKHPAYWAAFTVLGDWR